MQDTQCIPFLFYCSACGGEVYLSDPIVHFKGHILHTECLPSILHLHVPWEISTEYRKCDYCGQKIVPGDEICHPDVLTIHTDCLSHWGFLHFSSHAASPTLFGGLFWK